MQSIQIGNTTIDRIVEKEGRGFAPGFLLPDADLGKIHREAKWLVPQFFDPENDRFVQSMHSFLLRTPHHTILIDTCVGNHKTRPSSPSWHKQDEDYLGRLAAVDVAPEQVDFVLCTHLHVDHVGWNTQLRDGRWVPTFPNAKYLFDRREYQHWQTEGDYVSSGFGASDNFFNDSVLPVVAAGQSELVDSGHEIEQGLWLEPTPGHSPGHVMIHLRGPENKVVFSGDVLHHPVQCTYPEWNSRYCWDLEMSRQTRENFVRDCADRDIIILPAHFADPTAGRLVSRADGRCEFAIL